MFSRSFGVYFVVLFLGFLVFSPGNNVLPDSELPESFVRLDSVERLPEEDLRNAELYLPYISKYIENNELSVPLVLAVMKAESNFIIHARSHKGALGLMQLMPATALGEYRKSGMNASIHKLKRNLIDQPELNIALGVRYLQRLQNKLEGVKNPDKARKLVIASYNAGIYRVKRAFKCKGFECYAYKANRYSDRFFKKSLKSLPAETRVYLRNVEHYYRLYKAALLSDKIVADLTT